MSTYKEAYDKSLEYFNGDELAANVFVSKYALTDNSGDIKELTPDDMHKRLAGEFARIESKYPNPLSFDEIYQLLKDFKYIVPQGSPMNAIGNDHQIQSIGNCFVIAPVLDSYGGIMHSDQQLVQLMKRRCGVGMDLSNIRPKGVLTQNAARSTDGIGLFMERFSNTCREVAQGGRRGALMQTISIHHPEVETFINIKKDKKKVTGANISVRVSNEFMEAVKSDSEYEQFWPMTGEKKITKHVSAKSIWNQIISSVWEGAEPGVLFWDNITSQGPSGIYGKVDEAFKDVSTNPCGEIPMGTDSCRLLVINLLPFVKNPFTSNAKFDFNKFSDIAYQAQKLMDDVVDLELEKIDKILLKIANDDQPDFIKAPEKKMWEDFRSVCVKGRRTGLGITALGDTLAALNVSYGSGESIKKTEKIYKTLAVNAYRCSIHMAKQRGKFELFDYELEKDHEFLNRIIKCLDEDDVEMYKKYGRRNIALTTTAPTGSVSTLTKTTSGIEPAYLLKYTRRKKINPIDTTAKPDFIDDLGDKWQEFPVYHHGFKMWMDITGKENIEDSPYHKATSSDINWIASVKIQGAAQKWICHAISKTCNLPNDATKELISEIYMKAFEEGCKGFTVYRDGCRSGVLISQTESKKDEFKEYQAPKRPDSLDCDIHQTIVKGEPWTVFVGKYENKPYEIFGGLSKYVQIPKKYKSGKVSKNGKMAGKRLYDLSYGLGEEETMIKDIVKVFENPTEGEFTRILSLSLRHGSPIQYVVEQLQKDDKNSDMYSFSKVMARVLKHYIKDGSKSTDKKCSSCGATDSLIYKEGCVTCSSCGFSKCG